MTIITVAFKIRNVKEHRQNKIVYFVGRITGTNLTSREICSGFETHWRWHFIFENRHSRRTGTGIKKLFDRKIAERKVTTSKNVLVLSLRQRKSRSATNFRKVRKPTTRIERSRPNLSFVYYHNTTQIKP